MHYKDRILKSVNDKEFAGGEIFKQLVESGTIVPFDDYDSLAGYQHFTLDQYCYTGRTTPLIDIRAYILLPAARPGYGAKLRLLISEGLDPNDRRRLLLKEVLPEPDPEYPIYGDDWLHKLGWFLKADALGINTYDSLLHRLKKSIDCRSAVDLRKRRITTAKEHIEYLLELGDYASYIDSQVSRGTSTYGCQQRSRQYALKIKTTLARFKSFTTHTGAYWGIVSENPVRFNSDSSIVALVINAIDDLIKENKSENLDYLGKYLVRVLEENKHDVGEIPSEWTLESIDVYRKYFLTTTEAHYLTFSGLPDLSGL